MAIIHTAADLVKVHNGEPVGLSSPHVLYTKEEPLCVFLSVKITVEIQFIVPPTTIERERERHTENNILVHNSNLYYIYSELLWIIIELTL